MSALRIAGGGGGTKTTKKCSAARCWALLILTFKNKFIKSHLMFNTKPNNEYNHNIISVDPFFVLKRPSLSIFFHYHTLFYPATSILPKTIHFSFEIKKILESPLISFIIFVTAHAIHPIA